MLPSQIPFVRAVGTDVPIIPTSARPLTVGSAPRGDCTATASSSLSPGSRQRVFTGGNEDVASGDTPLPGSGYVTGYAASGSGTVGTTFVPRYARGGTFAAGGFGFGGTDASETDEWTVGQGPRRSS